MQAKLDESKQRDETVLAIIKDIQAKLGPVLQSRGTDATPTYEPLEAEKRFVVRYIYMLIIGKYILYIA